ncbi:MAG: hypothetical protein Unbinned6354contig1000_51 [Prokaryotic dsDNA virus sp.]|nr:hypothetical protein [Cytophagaceae bacterium]QDP54348.1 MAG: hypothetical protein Unbinned6354contig1000_51 [Prokaryotic dsDNA virus sp.]|tara:strand:+ start:3255 stop:3602 length:348 start_codon:yes stop_codon:yes gene_type:complete
MNDLKTIFDNGTHKVQIPAGASVKYGGPPTTITQLAFINRLTEDEYVAIDMASAGNTENAARLRRFIKQLELAGKIDLSKQSVIDGVNALVPFGLLTADRANEVLTADIQQEERA